MKTNLGRADRVLRVGASLAMAVGAVIAPVPLWVSVAAFGSAGAYLLWSALAGTCLGYRLMGFSTCPVESRR